MAKKNEKYREMKKVAIHVEKSVWDQAVINFPKHVYDHINMFLFTLNAAKKKNMEFVNFTVKFPVKKKVDKLSE